ncbi:transglutaminase-like cysteine peptidase [Niveibacterium umoris]|uniref:Putative transglutaminase-like cysteine proteinase n=1 Tax=Niveibacterium umoris TaxID=1193620 RepID=A0A840BNL1_9RHOO|nr:transglutaminase-like cysteine peptidase [Niveibacterium umoris]MBB4014570.1 putative transglutaminase-like cysteine proteinase [Niveibacterium umoris]
MRATVCGAATICIALAAGLWCWADDAALVALATKRYGQAAGNLVMEWRALVAAGKSASGAETLRRVNDFFNRRVRFEDDSAVWGVPDYWATPIEMLGKGAGDCEDYTIGKYFTLRELGVPAEKLRLIYVKARIGGPNSSITQAHMVLGYYETPDAQPLVLDNLIGEIRPAAQRPDLVPVFSFNAEGVYAGGAVSSVERLSRWKDLLLKMKAEGYTP